MDVSSAIFLVDGPKVLENAPLGLATHRAWPRSKHMQQNSKHSCANDADCPFTHGEHSCRADASNLKQLCEPGSHAAPEAVGRCRVGTCLLLSEKTHVYDVANRPWLLLFNWDRAKDPTTKTFLLSLIRLANRTQPEDRPSFAELTHRVTLFANRDAETYAALAQAGADEEDGGLEAAAVASVRSKRQHQRGRQHKCRGRRCRRREKKKKEKSCHH